MNSISLLIKRMGFWLAGLCISLVLVSCSSTVNKVLQTLTAIDVVGCVVGDESSCGSLGGTIISDFCKSPVTHTQIPGCINKIITQKATLIYYPPNIPQFDSAQARAVVQTNGLTLATNGGTATVTIRDDNTKTVLGTKSFAFLIDTNHNATLTNPSAANTWLHSFSGYGNTVDIEVGFNTGLAIPSGASGNYTTTGEYVGVPYASASAYIRDPGSTCPPPPYQCQ